MPAKYRVSHPISLQVYVDVVLKAKLQALVAEQQKGMAGETATISSVIRSLIEKSYDYFQKNGEVDLS